MNEFIVRLQKIKNEIQPTHYGVILSSRKNKDLKEWLISNTPNDCSSLTERMIIILNGNNPHICEYGNRMIYNHSKFRYCNKNCFCQQRDHKLSLQKGKQTRIENNGSYWTDEMKRKSIDTNIEKYGTEHFLKSEEGKERFKKIIQEKYGNDIVSTLQLDNTKEKIKQTNLEKYGVEYGLQSSEIKEKIINSRIENNGSYWTDEMKRKSIDTNIEKYGTEHFLKSEEGKERFKKAIQEKYGNDIVSTLQLDNTKEKIKQTNLDRYGVEYGLQSSEIKEKIKQTNLEKYGVSHQSQIHIDPIKVNELNDEIKFIEIYNSFNRVSEIMNYFGVGESTIHQRAKKLGLPLKHNLVSGEEQELADFLSNYTTVEQSRRDIISPKEIDIWLPEFNIGVEYNGLYYHSTKNNRITPTYHLEKTEIINSLGYKLIHIFSDEWIYKKDIVKSRLLNILNKTQHIIYARNTVIKEVDNTQAKIFLDNNHIQGNVGSRYRYGLFYNEELVSIMTFGISRFNKNYEWELLRFCNKVNFSVVGGASKLLNYFVKNNSSSIISYADRRWSDGNLYKQIGFDFLHNSKPNYYYVTGTERHSRNKYQKHKLKEILPIYDSILSEKVNMENNGYYRIYDCGNSVWKYKGNI
jgi:hypothetical protein